MRVVGALGWGGGGPGATPGLASTGDMVIGGFSVPGLPPVAEAFEQKVYERVEGGASFETVAAGIAEFSDGCDEILGDPVTFATGSRCRTRHANTGR